MTASVYRPIHAWLRPIAICLVRGEESPLLGQVSTELLAAFGRLGHRVQSAPSEETDILLTTWRYGEPLNWRRALLFTARRRFGLSRLPHLYTLVEMAPGAFQDLLARLAAALDKSAPDPADWAFPGLREGAWRVLWEQGRRGGPILALERIIQAQSKCIRVLLLVGEERPEFAYLFDLVGAHPRLEAHTPAVFYEDIALRMATIASTFEVTEHEFVGPPLPRPEWLKATVPAAMQRAARELGKRDFFTPLIQVADLTAVPAVSEAIASQYSEGCFSSWDPALNALVATVTGSARPVSKDQITEGDLALIVGVAPSGRGALVRPIEGLPNTPPSSEAVEMFWMDGPLPRIPFCHNGKPLFVPVVRSKLHGHRGVSAYDPRYVEFAPLAPAYYAYPVSCGTRAQAEAIREAFGRAVCLQNPADSRQVVFTLLPGHGVVLAEKWVPGKEPFQVMWEYMDAGYLQVSSRIPQGEVRYAPGEDGRMRLAS